VVDKMMNSGNKSEVSVFFFKVGCYNENPRSLLVLFFIPGYGVFYAKKYKITRDFR
jgi:hypothetical protein